MKSFLHRIRMLIILTPFIFLTFEQSISQNSESIADDIFTEIKNLDTIPDISFKLSEKHKIQLELLEYIYEVLFLTPPGINSQFRYHEYLYNSRLFYNGKSKIEIYSYETSDVVDNIERTEQYFYENEGKIKEIILKEDEYYQKNFNYNRNGKIEGVTFSTKTPIHYTNSKNKYHSLGGEKISEKLLLFYQYNRLHFSKYSIGEGAFSYLRDINERYFYYKDKSNFEKKYLFIKSDHNNKYCFRAYCFEKSELKHIFYSYYEKYWESEEDFRNYSQIHTIEFWNTNNALLIIYEFNDETMKYEKYQTLNVEFDEDYLVLNVSIDYHYEPMGGFKSIQYLYKYFFHNSTLTHYDIYKSIVDYDTNEKSEFTIEKSFKKLNY